MKNKDQMMLEEAYELVQLNEGVEETPEHNDLGKMEYHAPPKKK